LIILIILGENTSYESPHYAIFFNLSSLHLSSVQIFSVTKLKCSSSSSSNNNNNNNNNNNRTVELEVRKRGSDLFL
jgi:hypothetical protein